jgi:hypothetical protein
MRIVLPLLLAAAFVLVAAFCVGGGEARRMHPRRPHNRNRQNDLKYKQWRQRWNNNGNADDDDNDDDDDDKEER